MFKSSMNNCGYDFFLSSYTRFSFMYFEAPLCKVLHRHVELLKPDGLTLYYEISFFIPGDFPYSEI